MTTVALDMLDDGEILSLTDLELILRVQAGCKVAFGVIYRRHCQWVRAYLQKLTKDAECAEDLVQETFVRALERISQFNANDHKAKFYGWLRSIAYSIFVNYVSRLPLERQSILIALELGKIRCDRPCEPSATLTQSEMNKALMEAVNSLPELMAKCVVSHYAFDLSYANICATYVLSKGSVTYLLHRARRILAKNLASFL